MSLNIELLEDEVKDNNDEARRLIRSVLRELDRLNEIVSEYLQFSRFPKPHLKRGTIEGVIREFVNNFKQPANIALNVRMAANTPEVWLDEGLLRQVLDNLMRNAVEAITGPAVGPTVINGTITLETPFESSTAGPVSQQKCELNSSNRFSRQKRTAPASAWRRRSKSFLNTTAICW
jgi:signal transduction histidine kinase